MRAQLIRDLLQASNAVSLVADSPDEVLAFAIALQFARLCAGSSFVSGGSDARRRHRHSWSPTSARRKTRAASSWRRCQVTQAVFAGGHDRYPSWTSTARIRYPTVLDRPTAYAMSVAMRSMSLEENRALTLARGCGRSLTALARLIPGGAYDPPSWLQNGQQLFCQQSLPAPGIHRTSPIEKSSNKLPATRHGRKLEARLRAFLRDPDPPFDLEGTVWVLCELPWTRSFVSGR